LESEVKVLVLKVKELEDEIQMLNKSSLDADLNAEVLFLRAELDKARKENRESGNSGSLSRQSSRMSTTKTITNKDRGAVKAYRASSFAVNDQGGRSAVTTTTRTTTTSTSGSRSGGAYQSSNTSEETSLTDSRSSTLKLRNDELESEVKVLVLKVKELEDENRSSVDANLNAEVLFLKAELDKARKESSKAQQFSLELQSRLQKMRNENMKSSQEQDLAKLVETLSSRNNSLSEQLRVREERMRECTLDKKELTHEKLDLEEQCSQLRTDLRRVERERDQNLKWRSIANERGADINKLAHENAQLRNEEHADIADFRADITDLEAEIAILQRECDRKDESLKHAMEIHEEREAYLERTATSVNSGSGGGGSNSAVLAAMIEENRVLEERTRVAEEEAEVLKSFMENKRSDRTSETKAINVLKLGLAKEQNKNIELTNDVLKLKEGSKALVFENQQLRDKLATLSSARKDSTYVIREKSQDERELLDLRKELSEKDKSLHEVSNQLHHTRDELVRVHNAYQHHQPGINVMVRVKPGDRDDVIHCEGKTIKTPEGDYSFDHVFNAFAHQSDVFDEVQTLTNLCLDGEKVCVIAMGEKGSGKSFSMLGERRDHGIIPRTLQHVMDMVHMFEMSTSDRYTVQATFLGIFEDSVYDLFSFNSLKVKSKSDARRITFDDRENLQLNKIFEAVALETYENSSRVFTLYIHCDSPNGSFSSSMSIFDMVSTARSHKLLMDCLSGRGKALLLVHVTPSQESLEETISALKFAEKTKDLHANLVSKKDTNNNTEATPIRHSSNCAL